MSKVKNLTVLLCFVLVFATKGFSQPLREVLGEVTAEIEREYRPIAESTGGITSISVQEEQAFLLRTDNQHFAVVPFTYIPSEAESTRQCVALSS